MAFMDAIETTCEACGGLRYRPEALAYTLTSPATGETLNIAQTFDLSVRLASAFFKGTVIEQKLRPLVDVGLQYLHLNQALSTLSGGELQRLKLASYLGVEDKIFIVDEPTDGLHIKDIRHIIRLFDSLVARGNTVYMIEHNLDVIRSADFVLELGPGAGEAGGRLLFTGTPARLAACPDSVTAQYL
jgi:excinuclease UvrABC ATPase subunit